MFDPVMIASSLVHALVLIGLLVFVCHKVKMPRYEWPFLVLLLLWAGLVLAGHGASALKSLNNLSVYIPATFLGVGLMALFFHRLQRIAPAAPLVPLPQVTFLEIESEKTRKYLFRFLAITLGLFAVISFVIGMSVYPDNADSMIYRLPRAVWYVSSGSFLHPFESLDNRLVYYPLDGIALYVPLVLYGLPGTFHSIPSLISWAMVVYATYRFSRELGAARFLSLFAAWIVGLTPSILAQATSTNDEILASAVLLCSLYMGWRWLVTGRHVYFFMAGLALSLSAGTKLHIVFLMPIIAIAVLIAAWHTYKNAGTVQKWAKAIGWRTAITTVLMMVVMFAPFLIYNYASVGRFYFLSEFKNDVFNLSASLQVGFQNLLIYLSQMILSPLADLNFWPVANDRQRFNTALNQIFNPFIAQWLDNDPSHYHLGYRFVGITIPVSVRFVEFSLWSAFIWMLWPLQAKLILKKKMPVKPLFFLLAMTPPFWLLFWSFATLYMEGTATYFTFYLICAAPVAVLVFLPIARPVWNELRWVIITIVALANLVICHNLVMYSGFRALPDLFYARTWPYDWLLTEKTIIDEIRASKKTRIVFTHEKMPYFGYMHWNPSATYYSPFEIKGDKGTPYMQDVLQILPISGLNMYGFMPIRVPGKLTPGPTYLGSVRAIGREAIFATGAGVEKRYPEMSNYLLMQAKIQPDPETQQWTVELGPNPVGFSKEDQLTFSYEVKLREEVLTRSEPSRSPAFKMFFKVNPHEHPLTMTVILHSAWNGKELTRATYSLGGPGAWLPEGSEY